ncbi:GFA family protein [Vibrio antiquarius]|uniref:GFA family protein n=1 Tax=Vibrio antiquarius (strain Ex25) TaxID=150340 RepID=UPI002657F6BA|nr:GFA family protein [Vibrio antiquarius]MCS0023049.1 GFA family protein [Vibrio antiquarius]
MKGTCLCGAIEVIADAKNEVSLCHCSMCRKWSSGALHAVHCGPNVTFKGAEPKRYLSSDWAVRGFCGECGTNLFYHLLPTGEYILSAGLFDNPDFKLSLEIFTDEKPAYYHLNPTSQKMTSQQVFEQFSPKE